MTFAASRPRTLVAMLGLMALTTPAALGQQSLGYQGGASSLGGGIGQPLNLLSPTFVAPPPRPGSARAGGAIPGAVQAAAPAAMMTAPLPLPRPASAPQAVVQQASAPASAAPAAQPVPQAVAQAIPQAAEAPQPPLLRPSMDDWPQEEDRGRVIIPGAYERPRPAPATAIEAIAAAAPQQGRPQAEVALPARAVSFAAPVPVVRPGATTVVAMAPAATTGPVLASASSTPVTLNSQGTATTMVVPSAPAGSMPGAQQAVIVSPTPARGPVLAALPPDGGSRDWPRYVPGARGTDRNLGIAGERVMPDPGVPLACLPAPVRRALNDVALRFGPIIVRSTHRGNGMFVRTDAWRGSYHRDCRAADFRVSGNPSAVLAFLRARHDLGGVKRYRNGLFHIDNGPRRSW